MNVSGKIETQVVDTDEGVVYASPTDVFAHIRNKSYYDLDDEHTGASVGETSLTQKQVDDVIGRITERIDNRTKRTWRRRRVEDYQVKVKFRAAEKYAKNRRRARRGSGGIVTNVGRRGMAKLPHIHVLPIDSAEGDVVEVLNPREVVDITDEEGRDDGRYVVDQRKGIVRPDVSLFVPTGRRRRGERDITDAKINVSYRFGYDPAPTTEDGADVSTAVPEDIRDATALLVAARLVGSDQYGSLVPSGSDDVSLADAVSSWKSEANELIDEYRRP